MTKLKPCSFCGSDRVGFTEPNPQNKNRLGVVCYNCFCGTWNALATKEIAARKWNERVGNVTKTDMEKLNKRILAYNCMEWGFKASERGLNFDAAKIEFTKVYDGK